MNLKITTLLLILTSLFAFNSLSYYLYLSSHSKNHNNFLRKFPKPANYTSSLKNWVSRTENHKPPPGSHRSPKFPASSHRLKPWPILPSYLPWSQNPDVPFRACEAYFGNGFTRRRDLITGSGWFSCHYSETLRSSICDGGRIRMVPAKIRVSKGGERLEDVIGRGEEEEMPVFEDGAFEVEGEGERKLVSREILEEVVPEGSILRHTMRGLVDSIRVVDQKEFYCAEWVEEPTLLVTRFEYANLFHTVTDWYSAYVASRVTGLPNRPRVVFVDGHCKAPLEETWRAMFSGLRYAKNYSGPVCFRHAILVPLGYETALFKGLTEEVNCLGASAHDLWQNPDDHKTARLSEFGEMIRAAFGFPVNKHWVKKLSSGHNVLFVRREDYLAHPRHGGKVQSRLSNEAEVFSSLETWASNHLECKVNLVNGLFAHMTMKEQVRAIQDASVIIGAHGAGLTHIVSATPKTVILEIISSAYMRPHFKLIAQWKGLEYHAINLAASYANPAVVIDRLNSIMQSLGC